MGISREQAIAELDRRRKLRAAQMDSSQSFNPDMDIRAQARAELDRRRQYRSPTAQEQGMPFVNAIEAGGDYLADAMRGGAQGLGNTAISVANLPAGIMDKLFGTNTKTPHINLERFSTGRPYSDIVAKGGEFASNLAPGVGAFKALGALGKSKGWMGLLQNALKGFGAGYATGENAEGGGRLATGAFGGGLGALSSLGTPIANVYKGSAPRIAKRLEQDVRGTQGKFHKLYSGIDEAAAEAGVSNIFKRSPASHLGEFGSSGSKVDMGLAKDLNYKYLSKHLPAEYMHTFKDFLKNDSFKNARDVSSDLGKAIGAVKSSKVRSSSKNKALRFAEKAKSKIDRNINRALKESDNPELAQDFSEIQKAYKTEAVPLVHNKNIKKYLGSQKSEFAQKKLHQRLKMDEMFQDMIGNNYPEIGARENLIKKMKYGGIGTGALGGASYLSSKFLGKD